MRFQTIFPKKIKWLVKEEACEIPLKMREIKIQHRARKIFKK